MLNLPRPDKVLLLYLPYEYACELKKNRNLEKEIKEFRIIFEALSKVDSNVKFADVNSFVILDKAIKDVLFK